MEAAGNIFFMNWEIPFMEWFQAAVTWPPLVWLLNNLSLFGEEMIAVAVMGLFYWGLDKEKGKRIGMSLIVAMVWNPMIKNIFLRLRPYFCSDKIRLLRKIEPDADIYDISAQGYSFPSGHSTCAAALYGSVAGENKDKRLYVLAVILCLATGISRVYVGAHFPTDVICGWILGAAVALIIVRRMKRRRNPYVISAILLLTGLPGFFYCTSTDYYTAYGMLIGACAGFVFEEKFVNFENTKKPVAVILRLAGGAAIFFGLNSLLKLPFPAELLDSATMPAFLIRTVRYAVVIFVDTALYPMLFRLFEKKA